jgi:DNA-binding MarR family transcriptional regulator
MMVPSPTLGHHLEDLVALVRETGYENGMLFQLNNLDIGEIHSQQEMKYLFNALRDYTQMEGTGWLFVGDIGLRRFIAQHVDRLDDIISYEVDIKPIPMSDLKELIDKRVEFYRESKQAELPIDLAVFHYLYKITNGRLRYIFGLVSRLMNRLYVGDLTGRITLDIAKPMLVKLGKDRVQRSDVTPMEEKILHLLVTLPDASPSIIAKQLSKTSQYVGRVLSSLVEKGLASSQRVGRDRTYSPSIDATIAYTEVS